MPQNSLKVTRNFRGGLLRIVRVIVGAVLLVFCLHLLWQLLDRSAPGFDAALPRSTAMATGAVGAIGLLVSAWMLKGTFVRLFGVLLALVMLIPLALGFALTALGLPDCLRRVPLSILLVGLVIIYTGEGEWSLVPFAYNQSLNPPSAA